MSEIAGELASSLPPPTVKSVVLCGAVVLPKLSIAVIQIEYVVLTAFAGTAQVIRYVPDALCVELKSWKLYLWSYRDEGAFHEAVTNKILDDLVAATRPRRARVEGGFKVRGGIVTVVVAEYGAVKG